MLIRKKLSPDDVSAPNFRYDPDTNEAQFSPDGGETWVDSPGTDPRHNSTYLLLPRGGADPRCDAAANMVAALRFVIDVIIEAPSTLAKVNAILGYVKRFVPEIAFIIEIISYAVNFLNIIKDDLEDAFTEEAYEMIECSLYCHLESDGSITAGGIEDVLADVFAFDPDVLFTATQFIFQTWWAEVSLSNAGAIGEEVGDCDDCACEHCFFIDFSLSNGSAYGVAVVGVGIWNSGQGWVGAYQDDNDRNTVTLIWTFPETITLKSVSSEYWHDGGSGAANSTILRALNPVLGYNITQIAINSTMNYGDHIVKTLPVLADAAGVSFDLNSGNVAYSNVIYSFTVVYTGDIPPGWSDNCP